MSKKLYQTTSSRWWVIKWGGSFNGTVGLREGLNWRSLRPGSGKRNQEQDTAWGDGWTEKCTCFQGWWMTWVEIPQTHMVRELIHTSCLRTSSCTRWQGPHSHKQINAIIFQGKHRILEVEEGCEQRLASETCLESNKETIPDCTGRSHGYPGGVQASWTT